MADFSEGIDADCDSTDSDIKYSRKMMKVGLTVVLSSIAMSAEQEAHSASKVLSMRTMQILLDLREVLAQYALRIVAPEEQRKYTRLCKAIVSEAERDLMSLFQEVGVREELDEEAYFSAEKAAQDASQMRILSAHQEAFLEQFQFSNPTSDTGVAARVHKR